MIWILLGKVVVALFTVAAGYATVNRRADWLVYLFLISTGFGGFYIYAGTLWFPYKVVGLWSLFYLIIVDRRWIGRLKALRSEWWWLMVFWVVMAMVLGYQIEPPIVDHSSGLQGKFLRPIVQGYSYLSMLSLIPLALLGLARRDARRRLFDVYAFAGAVVCIGGYIQWLSFRLGFEFMPIVRPDGRLDFGRFSLGHEIVQRINSFAGEPKSLSLFIMPLFWMALVRTVEKGGDRPWWGHYWFVAAVGVILLLTYSTAALLALVASTALLGFVLGVKLRRLLVVMGLFAVVAGGLIAFESFGIGSDNRLIEAFRVRTVDRLEQTLDERLETRALSYMFEKKPGFLLSGLGLGMYTYHLPGLRHSGGVEPIDSGWVTWLLDIGIIGTGLMVLLLASVVVKSLRVMRVIGRGERIYVGCVLAGVLSSVCMNAGTGAMLPMMLWTGAAMAYVSSARSFYARRRLLSIGRSPKVHSTSPVCNAAAPHRSRLS